MNNIIQFSDEAHKVIMDAVHLAETNGCATVEPPFLAHALLDNFPQMALSVLDEMSIRVLEFRRCIDREMSNLPREEAPYPRLSRTLSDLIISSAGDNGTVTPERLLRIIAKEYSSEGLSDMADSLTIGKTCVPTSASGFSLDAVDIPTLSRFATNLNVLAERGKLTPVIGREDEINRVVNYLFCRTKCNPVLKGKPGVGKSAIVESLAVSIVRGDVPEKLRRTIIYKLDVASLLAGASTRGEFEQRMKDLVQELENHPEIVLFIDEFHQLIGAGGGVADAANILKPAMARGSIKIIGATTDDEYHRYVEGDRAFERRVRKVFVEELSAAQTKQVLLGIKPIYEAFHGVTVDDGLVNLAVDLTQRYVSDRYQPDKSIDLLDETMARAHIEGRAALDENLLREVLGKETGIPVSRLSMDERSNLKGLEERLSKRVLGQTEAVQAVASSILLRKYRLSTTAGPFGSFLFVGPTAVGKTELAKALASELMGSDDDLVRIDMSEYRDEFSITRLIGSPPGYVGYDEGGQLTEAIRRNPYKVVLLDEVDKAHPCVFDLFLQVLSDGRLTDGQGHIVDFSHTLIVMTANFGSRALASRNTPIGFTASEQDPGKMNAEVKKAIDDFFKPEFKNRLTGIIQFNALNAELLEKIAAKKLDELQEEFAHEGYKVSFAPDLAAFIASVDAHPEDGARPIKRAIDARVVMPLAKTFLEVTDPTTFEWNVVLNDGEVSIESTDLIG